MATVATRPGENLVEQKPKRIHLTPTGLLMEGDFTNSLDNWNNGGNGHFQQL